MAYKNLIKLIEYLAEFEKQNSHKNTDLESFAPWLHDKVSEKPRIYNPIEKNNSNAAKQQSIDVQIGILIGRMGKYARVYSKKALKDTGLSGIDDYTFMATLMFRPSMTKSELTHYNLMESSTSGADIIKRLIGAGYINEFDDEIDKRSKRVKITEKGKKTMLKIFERMDVVSNIITGNLLDDEKLYLLAYLKKLDNLHETIYNNDRKNDIGQIQEKYIYKPKENGF